MKRLKELQKWMKKESIDIFIINRTDEFLSEYIASYAERLKWVSNFSGSAGKAIIKQKKAFLFVDGRYTFQASKEVDKRIFQIKHVKDYWKIFNREKKYFSKIALDPNLHSIKEIIELKKIINVKNNNLKFLNSNPIDNFWIKKPKRPNSLAFIHHKKFAGVSSIDKIKKIQKILKLKDLDYYIINSLDSIAWLLNIRGNDIKYTPLIMCYLIIPKKGKINLFINKSKVIKIRKQLNNLNIYSFNKIKDFIYGLGKNSIIGMDYNLTNYNFKIICDFNKLKQKNFENPCLYLKAIKNKTELNGARKANIRDGASLTKFLYWLKNTKKITKIDEIKAANYLFKIRKTLAFLIGIGSSICGTAAIIATYPLISKKRE